MTLDFGRFDALTFDCYGTLIDWETGLLAAMRRVLDAHGVTPGDDELLEAYARHEAALESGPYLRYRDVLARGLAAVAAELGVTPGPDELAGFAGSVGEWPAFPDTADALGRLQARFRLVVITNCDNDLFAASNKRLGVAFDEVITAEQAGSYKPSHHNFEVAFERVGRLGVPRERILHVAQSLFHDHVPAHELGMSTVWVNRRHGKGSPGATPPAAAVPDLTVPDMATLADLASG
jgi:2-haloacid dehalogenase